jgi:non-ribosomal peptide synthetase component F
LNFSFFENSLEIKDDYLPFTDFKNIHLNLHYNTSKNTLSFFYQKDLFSKELINEFLNQISQMFNDVLSNPKTPIYDFSLVTSETKKFLPDPQTKLNGKWEGSIHFHFEENAKKYPKKIAVVDDEGELTYSDLNSISNQLARQIILKGVQKQETIAIFGYRSSAMVFF